MDQQNQIETLIQPIAEQYVPSSVEKKRALMMYFLFGIIIVISNKKTNDFEFFHLKQAMGWWMIFILSILLSAIILFIPVIKLLGIFLILIVMGIFVFLVKQAWDGKYYQDVTKYSLGLFPSLGSWLFGLFGINFGDGTISQQMPPIDQTINQVQTQNTNQTQNIGQTQNSDQTQNNS